jgi:DNA-binding CsgD family transcriptional regulator
MSRCLWLQISSPLRHSLMTMEHTVIVTSFIVFVLGLWTISYLIYIRKEYLYGIVDTFIGIVVLHNGMMFFDLARTYLAVNIVRDEEIFKLSLFSRLSKPLISFLTFLVIFLLIRLLLQISEKRIRAKTTWIFYSTVALYTVSYLARFISIYVSSDVEIIREVHTYFEFVVANCVYLMLAYFSVTNFSGKRDSRRLYNGILSTFYLAFLLLCSFPLVQSKPWYHYYMTTLMSLFNIFPLVWIKYFFLRNNPQEIKSHDVYDALNSLLNEDKITLREKEIAELILKGKSNKEIEEELHISVSTVKNHIYRLFRRLGINSRGQLVNLLLERKNKGSS